ncbi:MAG: dihydroorotate dehydrogenase electron transfer subunit [Nitrospirae bacterium]|nr:dihydroorotate dehydrogenase electron transfer subunit [Nitrospirota bacterium]
MWQGRVKISVNEEVAPGYFRMVLNAPQVAEDAEAGQFIHIRVNDEYDPLLRRPLSIHRIISRRLKVKSLKLPDIEVLYEVVGKGTKILAGKRPGEDLDILGPLGNGFKLGCVSGTVILIAGGMGVAPLLALAEEIRREEKVKDTYVIIGARTKALVLCEDAFRDLAAKEVQVATDDGSRGYKGLATDLLQELFSTLNLKLSTTVYACGPEGMLREVAALTVAKGVPCRMSLENRMGCGVGACLGCVVRVKSLQSGVESYKRVCKDGPVFEAGEIIWE